MKDFFISFIAAGVIMGLIDAVWLTTVSKKFYRDRIGQLLLDKPKLPAAVIFYIIYVAGLVSFVIIPAFNKQSAVHALAYGAFFGLTAFATYDLTNLATVKGFNRTVAIVDMLWGTFLTAATAGLAYAVASWLM